MGYGGWQEFRSGEDANRPSEVCLLRLERGKGEVEWALQRTWKTEISSKLVSRDEVLNTWNGREGLRLCPVVMQHWKHWVTMVDHKEKVKLVNCVCKGFVQCRNRKPKR